MSNSQMHGVWFEEQVKKCGRFPGAEILVGNRNEIHDVSDRFDPAKRKEDRLPSSVKTLKNTSGTICLADAIRFFDVTHQTGVRLVIGRFRQTAKDKSFYEVTEFILRPEHVQELWGELTREDIAKLRASIQYDKIEASREGDKKARKVAKAQTDKLKTRCGLVTLNRKIGSKSHERRIQCSLTVKRLTKLLENETGAIVHYRLGYGTMRFPLAMSSTVRENALPADRPRKGK
jgi:hypothetical protein